MFPQKQITSQSTVTCKETSFYFVVQAASLKTAHIV